MTGIRISLLAAAVAFASAGVAESPVDGLRARDLTPLAADAVRLGCGDGLELVSDGTCRLPVVFEDDDRAAAAADYLASVLEEACGSACEVYRLPDGASNGFVRCVFVPCPDSGDAFSVEVSDAGVRFAGRTDFAVYDFCERLLGVRHYWDGPGGRSVRTFSELRLPAFAYRDAPVFAFRQYSAGGGSVWFRVAKGGGTFDGWARCHTTDKDFCFGSPEGFEEFCRRVETDLAGGARFGRVVDRERRTVSVSPADVAYDCRCPCCRTLRSHLAPFSGQATPIIWDRFLTRFAAYMAERHPDYRVCVLPYWNYVRAPKCAVGGNVRAEVCSMSGLAAFKSDRLRRLEEGIILDWERVTGRKVVNWHYSCWPADYTPAAYVYGETVAAHYRRMREHTEGSFICGGNRDFPRFALSMYVWMRCLWNPEIDVGAVYDAFCVRQFGPAAKPMREVLALQEAAWDPETRGFPREAMIVLASRLGEASKLVRDTRFRRAFDYYATGFAEMFGFK